MLDQDIKEAWPNYGVDQAVVEGWVRRTWGDAVMDSVEERVLRALEEQIELYQAEMIHNPEAEEKAHALVRHVFGRPPGKPEQEVGGVMVTMMAYAACRGVRLDELARREIDRIIAGDREAFRASRRRSRTWGSLITQNNDLSRSIRMLVVNFARGGRSTDDRASRMEE